MEDLERLVREVEHAAGRLANDAAYESTPYPQPASAVLWRAKQRLRKHLGLTFEPVPDTDDDIDPLPEDDDELPEDEDEGLLDRN